MPQKNSERIYTQVEAVKYGSLKQIWDESKRKQFEHHLANIGWKRFQNFKNSTVYQNGKMRIEVDNWGAWLFEFKETTGGLRFIRTQGISDDRCDQIFRYNHDPNILSFKADKKVKRLDLSIAQWVRYAI